MHENYEQLSRKIRNKVEIVKQMIQMKPQAVQ